MSKIIVLLCILPAITLASHPFGFDKNFCVVKRDCRKVWKFICNKPRPCTRDDQTGACVQKCTQQCFSIAAQTVIPKKHCAGKPKTKTIPCKIKNGCPAYPTTACSDCKWPNQCPDSDVNADLHAICTDKNIRKSKTRNIPAGTGYYIQCAARNWCRPCGTASLELNVDKDRCM
eukprot:TCONS_00032824-protein